MDTNEHTELTIGEKALKALENAVAKVEEEHRRSGEPMAVWRDGKVVLEIPESVAAQKIDWQQLSQPSFETLVDAIRDTHEKSASFVNRTVNTALTFRNWLIGAYIHQYEFRGADKTQYGDQLVANLAKALEPFQIPATDRKRLYDIWHFTVPTLQSPRHCLNTGIHYNQELCQFPRLSRHCPDKVFRHQLRLSGHCPDNLLYQFSPFSTKIKPEQEIHINVLLL